MIFERHIELEQLGCQLHVLPKITVVIVLLVEHAHAGM